MIDKNLGSVAQDWNKSKIKGTHWWNGIEWSSFFFWCITLSLLFIFSLRQFTLSSDIWFLSLAGRHFLETGRVPHDEFYIYPGWGHPQVFGGWGFGVGAEIFKRLLGFEGFGVYNAILWMMALGFGVAAIRERLLKRWDEKIGILEGVTLGVAVLLLYQGFFQRSLMRPEVSLYVAWFVAAFIFERGQRKKEVGTFLVAYPLISWALAWVHTTSLFFNAIGWIYMGRVIFDKDATRGKKWMWALSLSAAMILPVINPNGIRQVMAQPEALVAVAKKMVGIKEKPMAVEKLGFIGEIQNQEYLPVWDARSSNKTQVAIGIMGAAIFLSAVLTWVRRSKKDAVELLAGVGIFIFTCFCIRGVGLTAMILLVPFGQHMMEFIRLSKKTVRKKTIAMSLSLVLLIAFSMIGMIVDGFWGVSKKDQIVGQTAFDAVNHFLGDKKAKVFTFELYGPLFSYESNEKYRTTSLIHAMLPNDEAQIHYFKTLWTNKGLEELAKYKVDAVAIPAIDIFSQKIIPLGYLLSLSKHWNLVQMNQGNVVFVKRKKEINEEDRKKQAKTYLEGMAVFIKVRQSVKYNKEDANQLAFVENELKLLKESTSLNWPD